MQKPNRKPSLKLHVSHQVLHWHQQFFGEFCKLIKGRGHFLFSIVAEIHSQLLHGIDV